LNTLKDIDSARLLGFAITHPGIKEKILKEAMIRKSFRKSFRERLSDKLVKNLISD